MQINSLIFYGLIEAIALLVLVTACLWVALRRRNRALASVRKHSKELLADYKALRADLTEASAISRRYQQQIDEQLRITRAYHQSLEAGQDIALDLDPRVPAQRYSLAFRYAVLVAEKEALNASSDGTPSWHFLETKFTRLISFYMDLGKASTKAESEATPDLLRVLQQLGESIEGWREAIKAKSNDPDLLLALSAEHSGALEEFEAQLAAMIAGLGSAPPARAAG